METRLADFIKDTPDGREADAILRACVHCGFCTATCPTYQLLGDELDGPRGRIYLIKQMLEGGLIEETKSPPAGADDERRRYYRLTRDGREAARQEMARMSALLSHARLTSLRPNER